MSSRIFQSVIVQMKDATDRVMGVVDSEGFVVACSELSMIGSHLDDIDTISGDIPEQLFTTAGRTYKLLGGANAKMDYAVFADGRDTTARCVCVMAAVAFNEARTN